MEKSEVVVITGASAGAGRAIARAFAKEGARMGLIARGEQRLSALKTEVEYSGGTALTMPSDVADAEQMEAAADKVETELGPIDIWVNCAMTTIFAPFEEIEPAEYRRATEVTYLGTVHGTLAACRRMIPRNRGTIVQVGSALAYRSIPIQAPYCAGKAAIRGFTDSVRCELMHRKSRVHITMVQMPALNTPQFDWCRTRLPQHPRPVAPVYQPEVAAKAVLWAARHRRREMFVGISSSLTIWGNKLFPWLLDGYVAKTAVQGQQTDQPVPPDRPDNLFEPVEGDYEARGRFGDEAKDGGFELSLSIHRDRILWAMALLILLGLLVGLILD